MKKTLLTIADFSLALASCCVSPAPPIGCLDSNVRYYQARSYGYGCFSPIGVGYYGGCRAPYPSFGYGGFYRPTYVRPIATFGGGCRPPVVRHCR